MSIFLVFFLLQCKNVAGYGFRRGGYVCPCRPGFHCPREIDPPFRGNVIEKATDEEYEKGFECVRTDCNTFSIVHYIIFKMK